MDNSTVIILASNRKEGNTKNFVTDTYGTLTATYIDLLDYTITPYQYDGHYPHNDYFEQIVNVTLEHDILYWLTGLA